ncbi:hypothetical protein FSARC_1948 [Fusarium sarcochroum]|uniref:Uncharacterized protein n=1 Tax=Fusarium sarcochroum TaxID=1208366 RepID=A0A8H4U7D3_9HYPO|nr:hypothetical protein FSARC_1948 [Fusarium sarcochroum]
MECSQDLLVEVLENLAIFRFLSLFLSLNGKRLILTSRPIFRATTFDAPSPASAATGEVTKRPLLDGFEEPFVAMRLSWAGQAAISGLVGITMANVLPLDDIPLMCVTICGPIVELTSKCDIHGNHLAKRQPQAPWVPKLAVEPPETDPLRFDRRDDELHKRSFSIIRAAPTSFPQQIATTESESLSSTSSVDSDRVTDRSTTRTTTASSLIRSTTQARPTRSTSGDRSMAASGTSWGTSQQTGSSPAEGDPEQECVCLNKSFDVAKVAALCQDCIVVDGHKQNNMDIVMNACGFKQLSYSSDKDSVVDNVKVEATRPTAVGATQVSAANAVVRIKSAFCFWVGLSSLLLGFAVAI